MLPLPSPHRSSIDSRAGSLERGSQVWDSPTIRLVPAGGRVSGKGGERHCIGGGPAPGRAAARKAGHRTGTQQGRHAADQQLALSQARTVDAQVAQRGQLPQLGGQEGQRAAGHILQKAQGAGHVKLPPGEELSPLPGQLHPAPAGAPGT